MSLERVRSSLRSLQFTAKVLLIFSPAAIQGRFEEIAGQTDMDTIVAAAAWYGMEIVG